MSESERNEIAELRAQLEQLRRECGRSAAMTSRLITAFGEAFRRERRAAARGDLSASSAVELRKDAVTLPLGVKDQAIAIHTSGSAARVAATALCSDSSQVVVVRLRFEGGSPSLRRFAGEADASNEIVVRLPAGETRALFEIEAQTEPLQFSLCRVGGEQCAVTLEIGASAASDELDQEPAARTSVKGTLWKAQELLREGRVERAMEVAQAYATDVERPALALLRATLAKNDADWLANVNAYVTQFGIAPIALEQGTGPRFLRLRADVLRSITGGPLVTVIMPAFNAEKTLGLAASSILKQSWAELELIIVDDCSTDCTADIAERLALLDARVKVLKNKANVGPYVSKNLALSIARGAYITCHDADDWAHPQRIEKQVEEMQQRGARACVASWLRLDEAGAFCGFTAVGRHSHDGALRLAHVTCMIEAEFMRQCVGHWDSVRFGADGEMLERLEHVCGDMLVRLQAPSVLSLDTPGSLTNDVSHGISKNLGLSPLRRAYRDAWRRWHATLTADGAYVDFPQRRRPFEVPQEHAVPLRTVDEVVLQRSQNAIEEVMA
jgi:glycosyltransferase involved in cell wall biosynthesis